MKLRIGQKVRWTSQSAGFVKKKEGVVVEIVNPNTSPKTRISATWLLGMARNHTSYVVRTHGLTYWPRVSAIKNLTMLGIIAVIKMLWIVAWT